MPDARLRWLVFGGGAGLLLLGLVLIATMSIAPFARGLLAAGWLLLTARQLLAQRRQHARVRRIRLYADGSAAIATADDGWQPATLLPGSVVLERLAWLRIGTPTASPGAELLAGNSRKNKEWRRLQVIWRHLGKPD